MRLKIVSDGSPQGTQVINEATGERVNGIIAVEWGISVHKSAEAVLTLKQVPVEITGVSRGIKKTKEHKRRIELD